MGFWYNDVDMVLPSLDTAWHHLAGVWDGTNVRIYLDGALQGTGAPKNPVATLNNAIIPMRFGCINYAKNSDPFYGALDEVMIFSRALTDAEITSLVSGGITTIGDGNHPRLSSFRLFQNHPNPFNPNTEIRFSLSKPSHATVQILSASGRLMETLVDNNLGKGTHTVHFRADGLPPGTYFYKLRAGSDFIETRKMLHLAR